VEKVSYLLWRHPATSQEELTERLRGEVGEALVAAGARGLQVNVDDAAVAAALVRISHLDPPVSAVASLWLDAASPAAHGPVEEALGRVVARCEGYLVTESEQLPNTAHPPVPGARTHGFANVALLRRPARLAPEEWRRRWQEHHTAVAVATQSTFRYVQDVVVRPLGPEAPAVDGIVEECFPPEALIDLHAFFDAGDDDELQRRMAAMDESVRAFGASEAIDVIPTSQYVVRPPFA
jgi:hypothetical protein